LLAHIVAFQLVTDALRGSLYAVMDRLEGWTDGVLGEFRDSARRRSQSTESVAQAARRCRRVRWKRMRPALAQLMLMHQRVTDIATQVAPPLTHMLRDWRHVIGRSLAPPMRHAFPAQLLESRCSPTIIARWKSIDFWAMDRLTIGTFQAIRARRRTRGIGEW
jgi:hypothetical protein